LGESRLRHAELATQLSVRCVEAYLNVVKLSLDSFELELRLAERAHSTEPYENWCRIVVHVRVPGFAGKFDWSATLGDLRQLRSILRQLQETVGSENRLVFDPTEPNIVLTFVSDTAGHIEVEYTLSSILAYGPRLSGSFEFDQTYIATTLTELEGLASAAAAV
jgi:hypothetical protein